MNYQHQHHPNPKRQRGIFHYRTAASSSYPAAGHTLSRQLAAIEVNIKAVEADVLKLLQEVAG